MNCWVCGGPAPAGSDVCDVHHDLERCLAGVGLRTPAEYEQDAAVWAARMAVWARERARRAPREWIEVKARVLEDGALCGVLRVRRWAPRAIRGGERREPDGSTRDGLRVARRAVEVAVGGEGGRNDRVTRCAFILGGLVAAGRLALGTAEDAMATVIRELYPGEDWRARQGARKARDSARRSFRDGAARPLAA